MMGGYYRQVAISLVMFCCLVGELNAAFDAVKNEKSVVRVVTNMSDGQATGTGSIINQQGYISTNHHVIDGGYSYLVILSNTTNRIPAELVWSSPELDLAILKIPPTTRPAVKLATQTVAKGADVYALGYPGASDDLTGSMAADVTLNKGAVGRLYSGAWGSRGQNKIIQHDAAINPGNSGGPLFDQCGRVVGTNTQGHSEASGIFQASEISELIIILKRGGISYLKGDGPCNSQQDSALAGVKDEAVKAAKDAVRNSTADATRDASIAVSTANQAIDAAQNAAQQAKDEGIKTVKKVDEKIEEYEQASWLWRALLAVGVCVAILCSFRKPRERIVKVAEHAIEPLSRKVKGFSKPAVRKKGLVLSGFDNQGYALRLEFTTAEMKRNPKGISIGRHHDIVDKAITSSEISRRHARIKLSDRGNKIEDLNSSNGTTVNGQLLVPYQPVPLTPGTSIQLGALTMNVNRLESDR